MVHSNAKNLKSTNSREISPLNPLIQALHRMSQEEAVPLSSNQESPALVHPLSAATNDLSHTRTAVGTAVSSNQEHEQQQQQQQRKLLTKAEKLVVIEKACRVSIDAAALEYNLSVTTIRKWIKQRQQIAMDVTQSGQGQHKRTHKDKTPVFTRHLLKFCEDYHKQQHKKVTPSILAKYAKCTLMPALLARKKPAKGSKRGQLPVLTLQERQKLQKFDGSAQWALYWLRKHHILEPAMSPTTPVVATASVPTVDASTTSTAAASVVPAMIIDTDDSCVSEEESSVVISTGATASVAGSGTWEGEDQEHRRRRHHQYCVSPEPQTPIKMLLSLSMMATNKKSQEKETKNRSIIDPPKPPFVNKPPLLMTMAQPRNEQPFSTSSFDKKDMEQCFALYKRENIYCLHQTQLCYRLLPHQSYQEKKTDSDVLSKSHRHENASITLLATTNATGKNRLPLVMAGSIEKPACLQVHSIKKSVHYMHRHRENGDPVASFSIEWFQAHFLPYISTREPVLLLVPSTTQEEQDTITRLKSCCPSHITIRPLPLTSSSNSNESDNLASQIKCEYRYRLIQEVLDMFDYRHDLREASSELLVHGLREGQEPNLYDVATLLERIWDSHFNNLPMEWWRNQVMSRAGLDYYNTTTDGSQQQQVALMTMTSPKQIMKLKERLFQIDLPDQDDHDDDVLTASVRGLIDLSWACNSKKEFLQAMETWMHVEDVLPNIPLQQTPTDEEEPCFEKNKGVVVDRRKLLESVATVEATLQRRGIVRAADLLSQARYEMFRSIKRPRCVVKETI